MRRIALLAVILATLPEALGAQVRGQSGRGELQGVVVDNVSGLPLSGVRVEVLDNARYPLRTTSTDQNGRFKVSRLRPGGFMLRVARIGFRTATTPQWSIAGNQLLQLEVRLDAEAVVLAPLTVTAARQMMVRASPVLDGFRARAAVGIGQFITRADIERRQPHRITDLLATVPGVHIETAGVGNRGIVYLGSSPQRRCPAQVFVDGMLLNRQVGGSFRDPGFTVDDAVNVASVEGIGVYRGIAGIPAEFLTPEAQCGVVVIWTRRGDRAG